MSTACLSLAGALGMWALGWLVVTAFSVADAISRHLEYRRIKSLLTEYGFRTHILRPIARSRCQRDAALAAARETGHFHHAREYFRGLGYRWYHVLPDLVIRNPFNLLKPKFLEQAFLPRKRRHRQP